MQHNSIVVAAWVVEQQRRGLLPSWYERAFHELHRFGRWIEPVSLAEATRADINNWLDSIRPAGRQAAPRTRHNYLAIIKSFYRWALDEELIERDPAAKIPPPKTPKGLPRPTTAGDFEIALSLADPMMRAWLLLGAGAGTRCMEIAALERHDIWETLDEPTVLLRGKGQKERTVPLHPLVWLALVDFGLPRTGPVFIRTNNPGKGDPFTANQVSNVGNRYLHSVGISSTMHQLRHKFGTDMLDLTDDLLLVGEVMGHENLNTTRGYAALRHKKAAAAVNRLALARELHPSGHQLDIENAS